MNKNFYFLSMAVMATITGAVLLKFVILGKTGEVGADGRTPVVLTETERDYVLGEMRGLVEGIIAINEAALEDDLDAIAVAAKTMGMSGNPSAETTSVMGKLPIGFKTMGVGLHKEFDRMAAMARSGASARELQQALNENMHKCVACHAAYKIETEE